jgi:membrane peptidoglycan carboxypeptidase
VPGPREPGRNGGRRAANGWARPSREDQWNRRYPGERDPAQFGRRDVRDDVRERLRQNGIGGDEWYEPGYWDEPETGRRGRRRGKRAGGDDWDEPGGRGPRQKGRWWRHWTWKKALGVVAAAFGLLIIFAAAGVAYAYSKTTIPNVQQGVFVQASKVYFSDGKTVVGQFGSTNRVILNYNQMPAMLRNAVVAAEDKNFWHEGGISPTGIIRAAYYDLTSSGGNLQGGSTITQQLVRNYYENIGTQQTISRKIKEIFVAEKLAQAESKAWILQHYMNTIYLGDGAYGVGAAAQVYFGLPVNKLSEITPAQAAMIAAMIQSPSYYDPHPNGGAAYKGLLFRWHYVLGAMVKMGTLPAQVAAKQKFPALVKPTSNTWSGYKGYIMQAVQYELKNTYHYSQTRIDDGGLNVVTTFSKSLMNALYASVAANEKLMKQCTPPSGTSAAPAACIGLPKYVHVGAVLEQPGTGAILAMYSGANYHKDQYDNALESRNQVGSSFKPYVLATAVKQGMNVQTSVLDGDSPLWIPPDSEPYTYAKAGSQPPPGASDWYEVTNDEGGNNSLGGVSVQQATAASLNSAYTDLWHRVALNQKTGAYNVINMAKSFGVDVHASGLETMRDEAGTALGQASLTVEEQATMIATLAAGGEYSTPHVIAKIIQGNSVTPARISHHQVLTPAQAADVDWAMSADTSPEGTAAGLGLTNGQTVIAKTGTTNLSQSAFFLGATQKDAMAVGMFVTRPGCTLPKSQQYLCSSTSALSFAPPKHLQTLFGVGGLSGYGGQWPALIWHTYFMREFNRLPVMPWPPVNGEGSKWNLLGPNAVHKPKPTPTPTGGHGCHGFFGHCNHQTPPTQPPTSPPTSGPTPTPTPTTRPTKPPHG